MQNLPPFPEGAYQKLIQKVYAPAFFEKLAADWNIFPNNDEERAQLLELGSILRQATETETVKQAQTGNEFLKQATDSLKGVLNAHGYNVPSSTDNFVKDAAASLVADQDVQQATLEFGTWLAQMQQLANAAS